MLPQALLALIHQKTVMARREDNHFGMTKVPQDFVI